MEPKYEWDEVSESEIVRYHDNSGVLFEMVKIDDIYRPLVNIAAGQVPDLRKSLPKISAMKMRPDDVIICAYMKAGTHWLWDIIRMLYKGKAEYDDVIKENYMLEFHYPEEFDETPSPRLFNTHLAWHHLPQQVLELGCKIIYIERNPKDVAVSYYNHQKKLKIYDMKSTFDDFVKLFQEGKGVAKNWFDYTNEWHLVIQDNNVKKPPILCLQYETMKKNPVSEVEKVAEFLAIRRDSKLIKDIAENCSFAKMQSAILKHKVIPIDAVRDNYHLLYRKGEIGDWKNWFTVSSSEEFDNVVKQKLNYFPIDHFTFE